ncbi:hypothetical protein [Parendozoicomonas sp. Alg238-R29]|uniref:hypothetical protein n=1 Tax=Parendozoicomonas sp. Alg238-R29 TaxID=2993446 RepID=UPI00248E9DA5|nr:hypothetical protein [Parendozoicomonas sp. Alg238-R29]
MTSQLPKTAPVAPLSTKWKPVLSEVVPTDPTAVTRAHPTTITAAAATATATTSPLQTEFTASQEGKPLENMDVSIPEASKPSALLVEQKRRPVKRKRSHRSESDDKDIRSASPKKSKTSTATHEEPREKRRHSDRSFSSSVQRLRLRPKEQEFVNELMSSHTKITQWMLKRDFSAIHAEISKLDEKYHDSFRRGKKWFHLKEWDYYNCCTQDEQARLLELVDFRDCSQFIQNHHEEPEDWIGNLSENFHQLHKEEFRQATVFANCFLSNKKYLTPQNKQHNLKSSLNHLDWARRSQMLDSSMRAMWIDCYLSSAKQLFEFDPAQLDNAPCTSAYPIIKDVTQELDQQMTDDSVSEEERGIDCLSQLYLWVKCQEYSTESLLVLACTVRHFTRRYIHTLDHDTTLKEKRQNLSNVLRYSSELLLFGIKCVDKGILPETLESLGFMRMGIHQIYKQLDEMVQTFDRTTFHDLQQKSHAIKEWVTSCCVIPGSTFMDALSAIHQKEYDDAHSLLNDLKKSYHGGEEFDAICIAKAWAYLEEGNKEKAKDHLSQVKAGDDTGIGYQYLLLKIRLKHVQSTRFDTAHTAQGRTDQSWRYHNLCMQFLINHQKGVQTEYPGHKESNPEPPASPLPTDPMAKEQEEMSIVSSEVSGDKCEEKDEEKISTSSVPTEQSQPKEDSDSFQSQPIDMFSTMMTDELPKSHDPKVLTQEEILQTSLEYDKLIGAQLEVIEELKRDKQRLESTLEEVQLNCRKATEDAAEKKKQIQNILGDIEKLKKEHSVFKTQEYQSRKEEVAKYQGFLTQAEKDVLHAKKQRNNFRQETKNSSKTLAERTRELGATKDTLTEKEEELRNTKDSLKQVEDNLVQERVKLSEVTRDLDAARKTLQEQNEQQRKMLQRAVHADHISPYVDKIVSQAKSCLTTTQCVVRELQEEEAQNRELESLTLPQLAIKFPSKTIEHGAEQRSPETVADSYESVADSYESVADSYESVEAMYIGEVTKRDCEIDELATSLSTSQQNCETLRQNCEALRQINQQLSESSHKQQNTIADKDREIERLKRDLRGYEADMATTHWQESKIAGLELQLQLQQQQQQQSSESQLRQYLEENNQLKKDLDIVRKKNNQLQNDLDIAREMESILSALQDLSPVSVGLPSITQQQPYSVSTRPLSHPSLVAAAPPSSLTTVVWSGRGITPSARTSTGDIQQPQPHPQQIFSPYGGYPPATSGDKLW